jgi:hypothetical protein
MEPGKPALSRHKLSSPPPFRKRSGYDRERIQPSSNSGSKCDGGQDGITNT